MKRKMNPKIYDSEPNVMRICDFEIVSKEPLERIKKIMSELIKRHGKFAAERRKNAVAERLGMIG